MRTMLMIAAMCYIAGGGENFVKTFEQLEGWHEVFILVLFIAAITADVRDGFGGR